MSLSRIYNFKLIFREVEKLTLKCVHLNNGIHFIQTCLNYGICPKFCKNKIRGRAVTNDDNYNNLLNDILRDELTNKKEELELNNSSRITAITKLQELNNSSRITAITKLQVSIDDLTTHHG